MGPSDRGAGLINNFPADASRRLPIAQWLGSGSPCNPCVGSPILCSLDDGGPLRLSRS